MRTPLPPPPVLLSTPPPPPPPLMMLLQQLVPPMVPLLAEPQLPPWDLWEQELAKRSLLPLPTLDEPA